MDLATSCKEKLTHFRVRELKDILTQLGLSKQGKKQDLIDRILCFLSDERAVSGIWAQKKTIGKEEAAKLVDDVYRKMRGSEVASKDEVEDTYQIEKVRCPCGSSLQADSMIKCEDRKCNVWQHIGCVIIPEKSMGSIPPPPPSNFYCELCRLVRADPFWVTVAHPLYPLKLSVASLPTDGTNPVQTVEKLFQLTRADRDLLAKPEYDVQAWCMLLNDKVYFRMQWPQYADLQINGVPVRAINRPGSQLLGANGRDDGAIITPCTRDGINKITLTGCDARVFCLGVRIVKRRTVQQILNVIPKESEGERFEDALARVLRCVGGGAATENADSDSDLEIVADAIPVNLRCPMSGSRMKIAGRFKPCAHMGCFDLEIFVEMNQRSRKWQCPICLKNYCLENVIIDPYFTRITTKMRNCGEDLTEIEIKPDGCWRVKADNDRKRLGDLAQWHLPDSTPMEAESKPKVQALKQVKQEGGPEGHTCLKLGIKKNINGVWEVKKPENVQNGHKVLPMSSSGNSSINQDNIGVELDSLSMNIDPGRNPSAIGEAEVIVLSDTEEETAKTPISSGPVHMNSGEDDFGAPFWSLPSGSHERPSFELFGSDVDHDSFGGPSSMDAYRLINDSYQQSNGDINDGLVDNPVATAGYDWISLRLGGDAANGLNPKQKPPLNDGALGSLADTASMVLESENRSTKTSRKIPDGPFSFPRQKRSVRPRSYFSIASDSEEET